MKKLYKILNSNEENILLDSNEVIEKYNINEKMVLMKDYEILSLWAIGITKTDADIEDDFYEFVYNNMPYSFHVITCIGHEPNTEGFKYYYTKEELEGLINRFPYIYRSENMEILDSKFLFY